MRIRSTKPEFWRSRRVASVSWEARLVLKGLESYVDDNGVGKDDLELIVTDLFSRDLIREPSRTLARVSEAISELHDAGLVWRYEADGDELVYISFWESIQRVDKAQKGRFRRPDGTLDYRDSEIREPDKTPREDSRNVLPGTGEQGNRGTGEQLSCAPADADGATDDAQCAADAQSPDRFEEFWDTYDHKRDRKRAEQKWRTALKKRGVTADLLIEAAKRYIDTQKAAGKHPQYTKHADAWLNGECWNDELEAADDPEPSWRPPSSMPKCPPEIAADPERLAHWTEQWRSGAEVPIAGGGSARRAS